MAALAHDLYTGSITVNQHGGPVEFQLRDCLQQLVAKQKPKPFEMCLGVICLARIRKSVVAVWHLEPHPIAWVFALLAQACLLTGFYNLLLIETSCCHTHRNVSGGLRPDPSQDDLTEHPRGVDAKVSLAGVCLKTSKNACADLAAARTVRERGKKRGELIAAKQGAYVKGGGAATSGLEKDEHKQQKVEAAASASLPSETKCIELRDHAVDRFAVVARCDLVATPVGAFASSGEAAVATADRPGQATVITSIKRLWSRHGRSPDVLFAHIPFYSPCSGWGHSANAEGPSACATLGDAYEAQAFVRQGVADMVDFAAMEQGKPAPIRDRHAGRANALGLVAHTSWFTNLSVGLGLCGSVQPQTSCARRVLIFQPTNTQSLLSPQCA